MRRFVALGVVLAVVGLCAATPEERKPATIPDLVRQLSSNDFHVRQHAARQLGNLGLAARDAVPALAKALHDPFPDVRASAGKALGQIGAPAAAALIEALKHRDAGVRTRAAQALGQAGPDAKEAVPALIAALKDSQTDVRLAAVDALGEMGINGKEAAPNLARLFHDPSGRVREHVRTALGQIGPAAIEPLCDALGEDKPEVRLDAIKTIALFGPAAKKAVPALRHAMKDEDHRIRAAAAEALGKMELDAADAVPELLAALKDKRLEVQREAVTALVLLTAVGVPDLLQKVREADRKGKWIVPVAAAQAIGKPKADLTGLVKELRDKNPQVRARAALQITELGAKAYPALPMLTKALEDEDPQVRLMAAMVIARVERRKTEAIATANLVLRKAQKQLEQPLQAMQAVRWRTALSDPLIQAQIQQIVMFYIMEKAMAPTGNLFADRILKQLGPEAVPALVAGINFTAAYRIGFC